VSTKPSILIVDDDPNLGKTLSDILRAKGYAPIGVATGKAALDKIQEEKPVVALIDLRLEDMSGLELMREIKECCPGTECIVLTGYASQNSAIEAVNLGAYSYVQKPYDMEQLLVTIRRAIEKLDHR
jgi:DNA-binding NtrC family response regulator